MTMLVVVALAITSNAEDVMPEVEDFDGLDAAVNVVHAEEHTGD